MGAYDGPVSTLADQVVARVNAKPILLSEVEDSVARLKIGEPATRGLPKSQLYKRALRDLVDEELLFQAAERQGAKAPEEVVAARVDEAMRGLQSQYASPELLEEALAPYGLTIAKLKSQLRAREIREQTIARAIVQRINVTRGDSDAYAAKLRAEGKPTVSYRLRHILVHCPAEADSAAVAKASERAFALAVEAQRGKTSFEAVARASSDDLATRQIGGDLGYVDEGFLAPPLEEAVRAMDIGDISRPVRTDLGFHVIQLVDKRTARDLLMASRFIEEKEKWLAELNKSEAIDLMNFQFLQLLPEEGAALADPQ